MKRILFTLFLAVFTLSAQANSIREWFYMMSVDPTWGVSVGASRLETPFEHSRFAFPDLAQGGPGCCDTTYSETTTLPAFKVTASNSVGAWGWEAGAAYLGKSRVSFDVSGPFGGSVLGAGQGRCVESGDFTMAGLSAAGTYTWLVFGVQAYGKAGMAANWLRIKTQSRCDLAGGSVDHDQDTTRFSMSPLVGGGVRKNIGKGSDLVADFELRRVTFSTNDEAKSYGQGKALVPSLFFGFTWKR